MRTTPAVQRRENGLRLAELGPAQVEFALAWSSADGLSHGFARRYSDFLALWRTLRRSEAPPRLLTPTLPDKVLCCRGVDISLMNRVAAAAATWIFRGDEPRRPRRG